MENTKYYDTYYGKKVSRYGLENGFVDYRTLADIVGDCILCNAMADRFGDALEWVSGEMYSYYDIDNRYEEITREEAEERDWEDVEQEVIDIYQWYIISYSGAQFLMRETDEIVLYDEELDVYVWAITHWGTGWDYVLTDIKLKEKN